MTSRRAPSPLVTLGALSLLAIIALAVLLVREQRRVDQLAGAVQQLSQRVPSAATGPANTDYPLPRESGPAEPKSEAARAFAKRWSLSQHDWNQIVQANRSLLDASVSKADPMSAGGANPTLVVDSRQATIRQVLKDPRAIADLEALIKALPGLHATLVASDGKRVEAAPLE